MLRKNKVDKDIIKNLYESSVNEAFNPENEEKNKIIRQALRGPKSYVKNLKDLQKMGINKGYKEDPDMYPGETIYLNGPNGKQLSVDPDGTDVWHTFGDSRDHYKKELSYKNRNSKHYTKYDTMDFNGDRAKSFDYYNYLTKPENKYQDEVDNANKVKNYKENKNKKGYNLPDEALTPEEKTLGNRARKYLNLKKDREELENKLKGYDEDKANLEKINKEISSLHEEESTKKDIKWLSSSVKDILTDCGATVSHADYSEVDNTLNLSCYVKADEISKSENDVEIYGTLKFDNSLKLIEAELRTSSGPNILNYNFIRVLNALYTYFKSGNNHFEM